MQQDDHKPSKLRNQRDRRRRKVPPPVSTADFKRAAARHLDRYPTTVAGLRAVLERRAARSQVHHGGEISDARTTIEAVLAHCIETGLLDDRAYGRALTRRLRKRGNSFLRVRSQLRGKGISEEICEELLHDISDPQSELAAAQIYAKRRRLGPHREGCESRSKHRERDLAKLGRAGFPSPIATAVIDTRESG